MAAAADRVTVVSLPNMTPAQLLAGATEVARRWPGAELVKNQVGNLSVVVDGVYVGYLDLRDGEVGDAWPLGLRYPAAKPAGSFLDVLPGPDGRRSSPCHLSGTSETSRFTGACRQTGRSYVPSTGV